MSINLLDSFSEFNNIKSIDRPMMVRVLEDVFRTLIRKKYGADDNFDIIVSTTEGDLEIWRKREVVPDGEVEDERYQIAITPAMSVDEDSEIGEECYEKITVESFGRRAIMAARQTLISRILELEKDKVYKNYVDRVGDLILGEVSQILKREIVVVDEVSGAELILPKTEMIRGDFFKKGDIARAVISRVDMKNNTPTVILSRIDNKFLERLLEQEVPEIEDGLITIRGIVRAPGERAKVAVESFDERIDPVGACVGMKGSRIHGIVRELRNENIDIINYTSNESLLIQRALTPAKVNSISLDNNRRRASVYLDSEEISKAIGKKGINIKLASELTNYTIDVFREGSAVQREVDFDVELDEFRDEIEGWIIDEFKSIGCDSALDVLELKVEELVRRTDLEEETIKDVMAILKAELENAEGEEEEESDEA
jgi:transcription termination/antitermination protein NusA